MLTTETLPDRETWLERRAPSIGGSDAPAIMGLTPWASPVSLWAEKTGKVARDQAPAAIRLRVGLALEPLCLEMLGERRPEHVFGLTPLTIATNDSLPGRHSTPDFLEFSPEGDRFGEIKTTVIPDDWTATEIPRRVLVQVQHMLAITEAEFAPVAVLINGYRPAFYDYLVPRSPELIEIILEAEEDFIRCVKADTPPPADGHEATKAALAKMYPVDNGTSIDLAGPAWKSWLDRYDAAGEAKKIASATVEESKNELRLALAEATFARFTDAGRCIQYKQVNKKAYTVAPQTYREVREVKFR